MPKRALLAGGGSGGHVFPGLAVAEELERRGWNVSFAGTAQGIEARLALSRGLEFHSLPARPLRGRNPIQALAALRTLVGSTVRAGGLIRSLGVDAVVATGGYVCVAAGLGAWLRRKPLFLVEPNASAGLANRLLSRLATGAALAWERAASELSCPTRVTGVPVSQRFFGVSTPLFEEPWRILVLGGSQGSASLNDAVPAALDRATRDGGPRIEVVHQAGVGKELATQAAYAATGVRAEIVPFIDDVAAAMARCHLVLSRAGAVTLAEICAAGRPSILFPLPLAGGHQRHNAAALEKAGAARVLQSTAIEVEELRLVLLEVLRTDRLAAMAATARGLAHAQAASEIADMIEGTGAAP